MFNSNTGGESEFVRERISIKERMAIYDALPKDYRDVLKDTVNNLMVRTDSDYSLRRKWKTASHFKSWVRQKELLGTRDTYGYQHPAISSKSK